MSTIHRIKKSPPIPKYITYSSDGFGRDSYVTYNNGGFLEKLYKVKSMEKFDHASTMRYYNTKRNLAPFKYHSDGSGRDNYVLHESGGLEKDNIPLKNFQLKEFLRKPNDQKFNFVSDPLIEGVQNKSLYLSKIKFHQDNKIRSLEKNLADRLYYSEKSKFLDNKSKKRNFKYHLFMRNYDNKSGNNSKGKNLPTINSDQTKRNISTAVSSKSGMIYYTTSKSKIKNKWIEETNEKLNNSVKNHVKNLCLITKNKSKIKNYDEYEFPNTSKDKLFMSRNSIYSNK